MRVGLKGIQVLGNALRFPLPYFIYFYFFAGNSTNLVDGFILFLVSPV